MSLADPEYAFLCRTRAPFGLLTVTPHSGDGSWSGAYLGWGDHVVRSYLDRAFQVCGLHCKRGITLRNSLQELPYHLVQGCMWKEVSY